MWQLLLLAWYNLTLDWTIFLLEPVLLLVVLTIQRRPSPKSVCMFLKRSLKSPTTKVWYPSSLQTRNKFLHTIQMFVMVLDTFLVLHAISRSIPVSYPSKLLVNQSLYISKSLSRSRLTRCYKWEFWSMWTKQLLESTVLYLLRVKISLEISSWESPLTKSIWIKQLCVSHIASRPHKM